MLARMSRSKAGSSAELPFERPIRELQDELDGLRKAQTEGKKDLGREIRTLEERIESLTREMFSRLSPWERIQLARHHHLLLVAAGQVLQGELRLRRAHVIRGQ